MQKNSRQAKNLQIVWSWGFHHTGLYEYGVLDQANVQADRGAGVCGEG